MVMRELRSTYSMADIVVANGTSQFSEAFGRGTVSLVVADLQLAWKDSLHLLNRIKMAQSNCPVVICVERNAEEVNGAMKNGLIHNYVVRDGEYIRNLLATAKSQLQTARQSFQPELILSFCRN